MHADHYKSELFFKKNRGLNIHSYVILGIYSKLSNQQSHPCVPKFESISSPNCSLYLLLAMGQQDWPLDDSVPKMIKVEGQAAPFQPDLIRTVFQLGSNYCILIKLLTPVTFPVAFSLNQWALGLHRGHNLYGHNIPQAWVCLRLSEPPQVSWS